MILIINKNREKTSFFDKNEQNLYKYKKRMLTHPLFIYTSHFIRSSKLSRRTAT